MAVARSGGGVRAEADRYRVLLEINNAIVSKLTQETLLRAISGALQRVLPFDRAALTLYDRKKDIRRILALEGRSHSKDSFVGRELDREDTHGWFAFDQQRVFVRPDLGCGPQNLLEARLFAEGLRSLMTAPLIVQGESIGTLNLGSEVPNQYGEADTSFLQEVANQVALAVENMTVHEEVAALKAKLEEENVYLQEEIRTQHNFAEIIGKSQALKKILRRVETVAPTGSSVLITGETGTGKELIARAIHSLSPRRERSLIKVNCATLPSALVESELFGHEKGAFTGAIARRIGRFELADGGTIFLDELGEISPNVQVKLLRVLQEREFERVGGARTIRVDVRVIAASNRDLEKAMAEGSFRSDLYYRLNVFRIALPPLRERREDIPMLVRQMVMKYGGRIGKRIERVSQETIARLMAYPWPGNIRELENVIERAVILSPGSSLRIEDEVLPPPDPRAQGEAKALTLADMERSFILKTLDATGWVIDGPRGAAKILGLHANTLRGRLKKLGIRRRSHQRS
jgi:formate hydrogenlyase transcriptional activator